MATRLILPDDIVSNFIPPNACRRCGRSDRNFRLLFPRLKWGIANIELIYPLRCPCGGSGCIPIKLPTLLFGYILANIALVDADHRCRSKSTMTVSLNQKSDMLANIFHDFDWLMETNNNSTMRSLPALEIEQNSPDDNDVERIKFGFDKDEWKDFLRRLGLNDPSTEDHES